jgi:hypothetical protein
MIYDNERRTDGEGTSQVPDDEFQQKMTLDRHQVEEKETLIEMKEHRNEEASNPRKNEPAVFGYKLTGRSRQSFDMIFWPFGVVLEGSRQAITFCLVD